METTIFLNNQTQSVRVPKELAFSSDIKKVNIRKEGKSLIITPIENTWDDVFKRLEALQPEPFERDQGEHQEREPLK
ncbi:MAG: type II toxin-antitoxin system VapB family antitoxin [Endozoicomonas sp.]|uniref:type II toxin-antitoxin system VapB family antitoxin n=1 Tax=Endozoicomonas sp. TaxID=1892382 RepID=UPI003D9B4411